MLEDIDLQVGDTTVSGGPSTAMATHYTFVCTRSTACTEPCCTFDYC